ncbi:hypothetical protein SAMN05216382_1232 [Sphingomonas palmae]|uniref:Uncharacterized protein n=1 Tax=Sphingomonas palmae TaxID=1855283 RepID=A0A1H7LG85_9SPHN|nr:hypothetical protein [Sphingomonas palmae]SEK97848.1 hypothetical protein SAMN05216382_1232 [Sphingomonas palmae]
MATAVSYISPLVQIIGGAAALIAFAFAPPERGNLLFVPLTRDARPAQAALADGFALLARGPIGSVVVRGDGARDTVALLRAGILVTAAPSALCGAEVAA